MEIAVVIFGYRMKVRFFFVVVLLAATLAVTTSQVQAQFNGHNSLGDFGLLSGSQPAPGLYLAPFYFRYDGDRVRDANGDRVILDPQRPADLTVNSAAGLLWYVSDLKILGANYGVMAVVPIADIALEVPIFGIEESSGVALADLYVQPINLGWHAERADFTAGFGFFAPSGRYGAGADNNVGLGMWTFELYGGATTFFGGDKSWSLATTVWYETHTKKKDSDIRVGDILTLEGGFGKSFLGGAANVGAAYYAQWKISEDDIGMGSPLPPGVTIPPISKHRVFGLGPEVTLPIATKTKLIAQVNVRFLWEFGARTKTEGTTLALTVTFPIPSVPIH